MDCIGVDSDLGCIEIRIDIGSFQADCISMHFNPVCFHSAEIDDVSLGISLEIHFTGSNEIGNIDYVFCTGNKAAGIDDSPIPNENTIGVDQVYIAMVGCIDFSIDFRFIMPDYPI